jgi:hypothetical protein
VKQLTGLDAAFLYMETPTTFGHVTGLMIFERPSPGYAPYAASCTWPDRASPTNWPSRYAGSSGGRWTAPGRCGRCTSSTVCRTGAGRCSPSTTTPPSTALPGS